jgi:hypothetical protein
VCVGFRLKLAELSGGFGSRLGLVSGGFGFRLALVSDGFGFRLALVSGGFGFRLALVSDGFGFRLALVSVGFGFRLALVSGGTVFRLAGDMRLGVAHVPRSGRVASAARDGCRAGREFPLALAGRSRPPLPIAAAGREPRKRRSRSACRCCRPQFRWRSCSRRNSSRSGE